MRAAALAVRFLLELCLLAAFAWWAMLLPLSLAGRIGAAGAVCVAAAAGWGLLLSPRRRFDLPLAVRLGLEAVYFLVAAAALVDIGRPDLGAALLVAAIADRVALAVFSRD